MRLKAFVLLVVLTLAVVAPYAKAQDMPPASSMASWAEFQPVRWIQAWIQNLIGASAENSDQSKKSDVSAGVDPFGVSLQSLDSEESTESEVSAGMDPFGVSLQSLDPEESTESEVSAGMDPIG